MNKPIHYVTNRFKQYREDRDWSQSDLANYLTLQLGREISREQVNRWENQKRGLVADDALEISKAMKISVVELYERRDGEDHN